VRSATRRAALFAAACVIAIGCAPRPTTGSAPTGQHNLITAEELARAGDVSLYEALRQLRPGMLRSHGGMGVVSGERPIQVYVGNEQMEGLDHLRNISARTVKEVIFLEPQQANARFGGNNAGGALVITLM
jgi:hypothetical protein